MCFMKVLSSAFKMKSIPTYSSLGPFKHLFINWCHLNWDDNWDQNNHELLEEQAHLIGCNHNKKRDDIMDQGGVGIMTMAT